MERSERSFADRLQDVEGILVRIPSGGWKVIYRIDQRLVKKTAIQKILCIDIRIAFVMC